MSFEPLALWSDIMRARGAKPRGQADVPMPLAFFEETLASFATLTRIYVGVAARDVTADLASKLAEDTAYPEGVTKLGFPVVIADDALVTLTVVDCDEGPGPAWLAPLLGKLGSRLIYLDAAALESLANAIPGLRERHFGSAEAALANAKRDISDLHSELTRARLEIQRYEAEYRESSGREKRLREAEAWRAMAEITQHQLTSKLATLMLTVDRYTRHPPGSESRVVFQRLKATVRGLRELVMLLEGRRVRAMEPTPASFDEIKRCVEAVAEEQSRAGGEVAFRGRSGAGVACVDLEGLRECIEELVGNARYWAANDRPLKIKLLASIELLPAGERMVQIVCEDNGQGVPDAAKHLIFLPTYSLRVGGKGLGLQMVKRFSEIHRGECYENGRLGAGARFVLRLPLERTEATDARARD